MIGNVFKKVFGSRNDRVIKQLRKTVAKVAALEPTIQQLDDDALRAKTDEFRNRLNEGATLESMMPEVFAVAREASVRVLGMRHFDVQIIGAMVLNEGRIAEMRTGEGKTLVATLAVYLNALSGKGVHLITVNDYLARRDAEWMGRLYHFLGLSTGIINGSGGMGPDSSSYLFDPDYDGSAGGFYHLRPATRREAYAADVTYGTNNEYGFDYLRDNMALSLEDKVQRELNFAIVDEVDSILIDEARTPLIISGPVDDSRDLYAAMNAIVPHLTPQKDEEGEGDYSIDEKSKQVFLTEDGHDKVENLIRESGLLSDGSNLYDAKNIALVHHLNAAMRAHAMYQKDVDYIVNGGEVVIVDEFTGRTMPGRRWSDGLHQAIEAKEGVEVQQENQTLASITFQNYFRLYNKLSGMTGTADTEAFEFQQIYGLEVIVIPTHRSISRNDMPDLVYLTQKEKFDAIIKDVEYCAEKGQPVLVGTTSIEASEYLASMLTKKKIPHEVLNAKQHEREAQIVAQAGRPGAVTIATNMAGRGTDIVLGGNLDVELSELGASANDAKVEETKSVWQERHEKVLEAGGLHIIGTERHESRRIDNQLRGRSGRQGDVGSTRFYLSLEDNLMRIFASERVSGLMQKLGMEEGEAIEHPWVSKAIENAQRKVEAHNFDMRKHLLEYDDVANDQRRVIYDQRSDLIASDDISETIAGMTDDVVDEVMSEHFPAGSLEEQWDVAGATQVLQEEFGQEIDLQAWLDADDHLNEESIKTKVAEHFHQTYADKQALAGEEALKRFEKFVMLKTLDEHWKEHLAAMDYLRQSIGLRGYAQKDPKQEYKRESFEMFSGLIDGMKREVVSIVARVQVQDPEEVAREEQERAAAMEMDYQHASAESALAGDNTPEADAQAPYVRDEPKLGRNDPCWCGSGKKYKQCHGKLK